MRVGGGGQRKNYFCFPSERNLLKKGRLCSQGDNFFPFREDPFSEGVWNAG